MTTAIWWIRRDLRLTDNQALYTATTRADQVLPVFILDRKLLSSSYASTKRTAFLFDGLRALDASLRERGSRLIVREGDPRTELARLRDESSTEFIFAEQDYSPYAKKRDTQIAAELPLNLLEGVAVQSPNRVLKKDGTPYTVYTPYSRRWRASTEILRHHILPAPTAINTPDEIISLPIPDTPTLPEIVPFPAGEQEGKHRLCTYIKGGGAPIYEYTTRRDFPGIRGTSLLSPYLRFGMISARFATVAAQTAMHDGTDEDARASAAMWLGELIWRDFYISILHHFPHVHEGSFRPEYDRIAWTNDEEDFAAWCAGQTGYPFIDAAMRQLVNIGWMHNRARMAVASFLVKDLLIDWRWGERWFMQQLIDGDPAANNGGWQWSAGTGTDTAPYFRIFNPISQGIKFDPAGAYVRQWVPELARVPDKFIHEPWKMPHSKQVNARCTIGKDYPFPIVDHKEARQRTLAAYKTVKGSNMHP